jgi:hypothetical protein
LLYTLGRSGGELALIAGEEDRMRLILVGFLVTGLFVIGLATYDREVTNEDGTPIPQPPKRPK